MLSWALAPLFCLAQKSPVNFLKLPSDTTQLWLMDGNPNSDTVLIHCQGGPAPELGFAMHGRSSLRYVPRYATYQTLYLHQAQTFYPKVLHLGRAEAEQAAALTVLFLEAAVAYQKRRGKQVILIGHSYGAFIILNYLSTCEAQADRYIISAGRLNVPMELVELHQRGENRAFQEDGMALVREPEDLSDFTREELRVDQAKNFLKAALGSPRYADLLQGKDLSTVSFFFAHNDQRVGGLTESERECLTSLGATVFENQDGHGETFYRFIDAVTDGSIKLASNTGKK